MKHAFGYHDISMTILFDAAAEEINNC